MREVAASSAVGNAKCVVFFAMNGLINEKGSVIMRHAICFVIVAVVPLLRPHTVLAYHDMTCHPPPPPSGPDSFFDVPAEITVQQGQELNLIVPGASGATSSSCSSAGDDRIEVALPPDEISALEHIPGTGQDGRSWLFEPTSNAFRDSHVGLSAQLPNFTKPDGTSLLTQYKETNLDFLLSTARTFTPGETFAVSSGEIGVWLGATLLDMPASFTLDELLAADPIRFPAYTGTAVVADIETLKVVAAVPEPASALLGLVSLSLLMIRRR